MCWSATADGQNGGERRCATEWQEKVAMLFMKPGEDPSDLSRRRDIWLECHGHKLMMWLLGAEYERASATAISRQAAARRTGGARGRE